MKKLNKQDVHNILLGSAIVGTGGGGSLVKGLEIVNKTFDEGYEFILAKMDEIPDEAFISSPYACGSIGGLSEKEQEMYDKIPKSDELPEIIAVKEIEKLYNKKFAGFFAAELGGFNTALALNAAARMGKFLVDGDPAGRSVPCLNHSTLTLNNIQTPPIGVANNIGDTMIITNVANDARAESLVRLMAMASFNSVGVVDHCNLWKALKNGLIEGTISYCKEIGEIARLAKKENRNYAYDVIDRFDGYIIFDGEITNANWHNEDGFTYGELLIKGEGEYKKDELKIWYQNEYIMSWKNNIPYVTVPDSINIVIKEENMPLINPNGEMGMKVTVFALKAFEAFRSSEGIKLFGPKAFGYDISYKKLENIIVE